MKNNSSSLTGKVLMIKIRLFTNRNAYLFIEMWLLYCKAIHSVKTLLLEWKLSSFYKLRIKVNYTVMLNRQPISFHLTAYSFCAICYNHSLMNIPLKEEMQHISLFGVRHSPSDVVALKEKKTSAVKCMQLILHSCIPNNLSLTD